MIRELARQLLEDGKLVLITDPEMYEFVLEPMFGGDWESYVKYYKLYEHYVDGCGMMDSYTEMFLFNDMKQLEKWEVISE